MKIENMSLRLGNMSLGAKKKALADAAIKLMNSVIPSRYRMAGRDATNIKVILRSTAAFTDSLELRTFTKVLRSCILGERNVAWLKDALGLLETGINKKAGLRAEAFGKAGAYCIHETGSWERWAVHYLCQYTEILASDPRLAEDAPISICDYCDGLYLKTKKGQQYCSSKCRVAQWSSEKGKEYFAEAQRRRRAAKKKTVKKTVVKTEGKLSAKSREMKGKTKTK